MLHAAEVIRDLLHDPDLQGNDLVGKGERQERGVGVIEAPRGTLIHHYKVDENDQIVRANLIVSTTHNNQAMNEAIRQVARQYLDGTQAHRGAAQPHRSGHPRLRPLPVLRHPRAGQDAAGSGIAGCGRAARSTSWSRRTAGLLQLTAPILIIGIGNPSRGDDALGPLLIERLEALNSARRGTAHRLPVAGGSRAGYAGAAAGGVRRRQPGRRRAVSVRARHRARRTTSFSAHALTPRGRTGSL